MVRQIRAKITGRDGDTAYIDLPHMPRQPEAQSGVCAKTVRLDSLIDGYKGPMVNLDFNKDGVLIGIEILVFEADKRAL